jgi:hypothetical protein
MMGLCPLCLRLRLYLCVWHVSAVVLYKEYIISWEVSGVGSR